MGQALPCRPFVEKSLGLMQDMDLGTLKTQQTTQNRAEGTQTPPPLVPTSPTAKPANTKRLLSQKPPKYACLFPGRGLGKEKGRGRASS